MSGLLLTELETPALRLDLQLLQQEIGRLSTGLQAAGKKWIATAEGHLLSEWSLRETCAGASGIAVDLLPDVARFSAAGVMSIHLSQPPIGSDLLPQLLASCPELNLTVGCDHYQQAEELSAVAISSGRQIGLLIELNTGEDRFGVRPGFDSLDLARGIAHLPGVIVCGLSATLGNLTDVEVAQRRSASALGMLEESLERLQREGHRCERISVAVDGNIEPVRSCPIVTELRTGLPIAFTMRADENAPRPLPLLAVIATVFSRSKLERAVLDVGQSHLGICSPAQIRVRSTATGRLLPDARVEAIDWNSLTLDLGPRSREIVIGDRILLELDDPRFALRLFPAVHVVEAGLIKEFWATSAFC